MRESGSRQSRDSGCLPFIQNFRNFPDFILENFEMEQMPSICLVPECTRLMPRVSALSPLPQALFSTSNATHLCRELLCNFLEYVFVAFPTPNKYLLSSHVEIKRHMSASPNKLRLFPAAQVLGSIQFRPMNKKVQRRRQKKQHAKYLY